MLYICLKVILKCKQIDGICNSPVFQNIHHLHFFGGLRCELKQRLAAWPRQPVVLILRKPPSPHKKTAIFFKKLQLLFIYLFVLILF